MIGIAKASPNDAGALAHASERAFHSDIHCGAPSIGGPPGYDAAAWQSRMMRAGDYTRVVADGRIVGGMIVFRTGPHEYELGRVFVDPRFPEPGNRHASHRVPVACVSAGQAVEPGYTCMESPHPPLLQGGGVRRER
jgi:hypothetical protein